MCSLTNLVTTLKGTGVNEKDMQLLECTLETSQREESLPIVTNGITQWLFRRM